MSIAAVIAIAMVAAVAAVIGKPLAAAAQVPDGQQVGRRCDRRKRLARGGWLAGY